MGRTGMVEQTGKVGCDLPGQNEVRVKEDHCDLFAIKIKETTT